ncbi:Putative ribonuclease H protein At1g65750 [Linum perenne]
MPATRSLGRYLGIPLIHGRVTNAHFKYILENMDAKLSGWKRETLSLAGRVTLASSVLNAIPSFAMQTTVLPMHICDQIDQKIRSFVRGSEQGQRKMHLVNWETVCQPKELGGLGLKSARSFNQAFILKLAWGILKKPKELWAGLLLTKYLKPTENGLIPRGTKRFSNLWKGIKLVWPFLNLGLQWSIGDGKSTSFWTDIWLDSGQRLIDHVIPQSGFNVTDRVVDFRDSAGTWDLGKLQQVLPIHMLQQVLGMVPPREELGADKPIWGLEGNGTYSVKSGYALINDFESRSEEDKRVWKSVWHWPGPNKIRHFLWLASHGKLLTNKERKRRHISTTEECPRCGADEESIEHCLRSCPVAQQVWSQLVAGPNLSQFLNVDYKVWWEVNIRSQSWGVDFGVACWLLWKHRNEWIFQNRRSAPPEVIHQLHFWKQAIHTAAEIESNARSLTRAVKAWKDVAWSPAPDPWITLNTDGSVSEQKHAAAGGALRTRSGDLLVAYTMNLGVCSITRAEIRGIIEGMQLAWTHGGAQARGSDRFIVCRSDLEERTSFGSSAWWSCEHLCRAD